jgi:hypothetical protein
MAYVGPGKGDYLVFTEGIDNDGDGKFNEDGVGGLDLNRNYPENWRPITETTELPVGASRLSRNPDSCPVLCRGVG